MFNTALRVVESVLKQRGRYVRATHTLLTRSKPGEHCVHVDVMDVGGDAPAKPVHVRQPDGHGQQVLTLLTPDDGSLKKPAAHDIQEPAMLLQSDEYRNIPPIHD